MGDGFKRKDLGETVLERSYWSTGSVHDFPWASAPLEKLGCGMLHCAHCWYAVYFTIAAKTKVIQEFESLIKENISQ